MAQIIKIEGHEPEVVEVRSGFTVDNAGGLIVLEFNADGGKSYRLVLDENEALETMLRLNKGLLNKRQS